MEAYLNTILFGGNIYGIKMACRYYFDTTPDEITLAQAAVLAGMIQGPNHYHPFLNPEATDQRKNVVLHAMLEEGYITDAEYLEATSQKVEEITKKGFTNPSTNYLTPYLDYINQTLPMQSYPIEKIETYLDPKIQKELYAILNNDYNLFNDDALNCAIVVLDNQTYGIKAIAGNRSLINAF